MYICILHTYVFTVAICIHIYVCMCVCCVSLYSDYGANLHGLVKANRKHLFSAVHSTTSCWRLEIGHSGIFTL